MTTFLNTAKKTAFFLWVALIWPAAGFAQDGSKTISIGVVIDDPSFSEHLDWLKTGMAEFGYVEDENIRYTFYGLTERANRIDDIETERVLSDKPDIIFTVGNHSAAWAQKAIEGTDIPALFCMISSDPVGEGMVESLGRPKGNMTGIRVPDVMPKALEWLVAAVPGIEKIALPYDPADEISILALNGLDRAALRLGIELIDLKVDSVEEAVAAIEALPEDVDAIFRVPSQTLDPGAGGLSQAAINRKLPMGAANKQDETALVTFRPDIEETGRQAARIANKILRGVKPSDLPVETLEVTLIINLRIAEKIGIRIPNTVLVNADNIIR
jgi:putative ABC transport system substrate-binding protein